MLNLYVNGQARTTEKYPCVCIKYHVTITFWRGLLQDPSIIKWEREIVDAQPIYPELLYILYFCVSFYASLCVKI
jgi:hypothetical protein